MAVALARILQFLVGGLLARVLVGAGMTVITYAGLSVAVEELLNQMVLHMGGLPSAVLNIALMFGVGEAINIIGSSMLTVLAWKSLGLGLAFTNQTQTA